MQLTIEEVKKALLSAQSHAETKSGYPYLSTNVADLTARLNAILEQKESSHA